MGISTKLLNVTTNKRTTAQISYLVFMGIKGLLCSTACKFKTLLLKGIYAVFYSACYVWHQLLLFCNHTLCSLSLNGTRHQFILDLTQPESDNEESKIELTQTEAVTPINKLLNSVLLKNYWDYGSFGRKSRKLTQKPQFKYTLSKYTCRMGDATMNKTMDYCSTYMLSLFKKHCKKSH